jgi:Lipopolysaccharide-assembly
MRFVKLTLPLLFVIFGGCGYRLATKPSNAGSGKTIAVPTFSNLTKSYRIEQRFSDVVRSELIRRTKYKVISDGPSDVLISGEVIAYGAYPNIIVAGRASTYTISVDLRILITDVHSGKVLYSNADWTFHDNFELASNSADFVPEEPAAVERVARSFSSSLVAALLNATP